MIGAGLYAGLREVVDVSWLAGCLRQGGFFLLFGIGVADDLRRSRLVFAPCLFGGVLASSAVRCGGWERFFVGETCFFFFVLITSVLKHGHVIRAFQICFWFCYYWDCSGLFVHGGNIFSQRSLPDRHLLDQGEGNGQCHHLTKNGNAAMLEALILGKRAHGQAII